ncbi:MAG: hypothetical protein ACMUIE_05420 [Thermoplasmatota archaeon]
MELTKDFAALLKILFGTGKPVPGRVLIRYSSEEEYLGAIPIPVPSSVPGSRGTLIRGQGANTVQDHFRFPFSSGEEGGKRGFPGSGFISYSVPSEEGKRRKEMLPSDASRGGSSGDIPPGKLTQVPNRYRIVSRRTRSFSGTGPWNFHDLPVFSPRGKDRGDVSTPWAFSASQHLRLLMPRHLGTSTPLKPPERSFLKACSSTIPGDGFGTGVEDQSKGQFL